MIKLSISPQTEAFRQELIQWLAVNAPDIDDQNPGLSSFIKRGRSWQAKLAQARWIGVHWPKEYGGRGLSLVEEAVVQEELVRINAPQIIGLFGLTMVGPVLIKYGNEQQKQKYLADILAARTIWCQGFSEPEAGSDLANIKTKALPVNDSGRSGYLLTGQKVWTSFAQIANYCFVLARTSDEPKKHQGLSYLLVDMTTPGITTRPLTQISGDQEFNEVFFDNVFVPQENVVGRPGEGWSIAISTLMFERVVLTFARQLQSEVALRRLMAKVDQNSDSVIVQRLKALVVEACAVRALAYRHLLDYAAGKDPGPEGSMDKLLWSESFQRIAKLELDLLSCSAALGETHPESAEAVHQYLYSRGRTIAAGTSEIQRSIIAERVMGLGRVR